MTDVVFTAEGGGIALVTQRKVPEGTFVKKNEVIIEYRPEGADPKSRALKMHAPDKGVVTYKPGTERGDRLADGAPLCTLSECPHQVVMKDMCAACGENLRERDGRPGERKTTTIATVPMNHSLPELLVSDEIARADGAKHKKKCLEQRKLVLLVDLDQTVIHTTNRPPTFDPAKHPDISHFSLYRSSHWTKLRPHTRAFFENLSAQWEMHIITFGQRMYAHKIAEIIDPTRIIFSDRILSRDESLSQQHKTKNLAALFPAGEEMVAIIDDRPDVWEFSDALVQLRPYKYFPDVDDINAPPGADKRPEPEAAAAPAEGESGDNLPEENDETLVHVEKVLKKVHEAFFEYYDRTGNVRDLKLIISSIREQSLKGYVLVLSGLIPVGTDPKRSDVYRIATKFGARVEDKVDEQTTHVVAARWGTTKVLDGRRLGVPIVTPHWVYACMELWEKAPEQPYILTEKSASPIGGSLGSSMGSGLADMPVMSRDLLSDMANEVDSLSDEDEDESEGEENEDDEGGDGEMPLWKEKGSRVRAPQVARPKIDESRVKRKLCPEALDRGYTGKSAGEEDEDDDPFGGSSSKRLRRRSRAEEVEKEEERAEEEEEEQEAVDYGEDEEQQNEDEDDEFDDMAAELEHQLEH